MESLENHQKRTPTQVTCEMVVEQPQLLQMSEVFPARAGWGLQVEEQIRI